MNHTLDLSLLVDPRSVVVVGASERPASIGERVLTNLLDHSDFRGNLYLVNATRTEIRGHKCYERVAALPETPDLAVVAVPAGAVLGVIEECASRGVRFAIILSSGFGEAGEEGHRMQEAMKRIAERSGMRIYGPNCPGLCNVNKRLGFTFSPAFKDDLNSGPVGLVTQGGGLGRSIMQAMRRGFGVGLWASTGNEVDLQVSDFIRYMADAEDIRVIVALLEGIKDGPRFLDAIRHAARKGKPIVALKVGKSEYGMKAAQSHTASITGSAEVNSTVFRQFGVIEVDDLDELVDTAWLLVRKIPDPASQVDLQNEIGIYCSSGGTTALTADMVGAQGVRLADFAPETLAVLREHLPSYAATANPIDTTTAVLADPTIVEKTMAAVCRDPGVSMVLLPMALDYGSVTERTARDVVRVQAESPVPIVPIWMSDSLGGGFSVFSQAGMMPMRSAGKAVKAIHRWGEYARWKRDFEPDRLPLRLRTPAIGSGAQMERASQSASPISEPQAKAWLAAAGVPVPRCEVARDVDEALDIASRIGYPVVAKVVSPDIQHKSDVGGVSVGIRDDESLRNAWRSIHASVSKAMPEAEIEGLLIEGMAKEGGVEVLVGVSRDPVFGHVLTFGLGGIYVELFKDVARRLLPLTPNDALAMIREIRSFPVLDGARGRPSRDLEALQGLLLKMSDFVSENADRIEEIDLNPVWVGEQGQGVIALDALIAGSLPGDFAR
ncbi:MAG: acyl-CoA synthetase [Lautropia sp. SCN 70-15]|nr:MAG: acyl-CoA synthetase [Lautropia sp. SCN 70-15]